MGSSEFGFGNSNYWGSYASLWRMSFKLRGLFRPRFAEGSEIKSYEFCLWVCECVRFEHEHRLCKKEGC